MAKRSPKQHRTGWTDKDVATLTKMALTAPAGMIANALDRTVSAIRRKAGLIGLSLGAGKRSSTGKRPNRASPKKLAKKR